MKAVILAGGSGTRLWPLSRTKTPKQFHALNSNKTLFQETIARLDFLKPKDIYIATHESYLSLIKKQAPQIPKENIILEPALRDTASCIGYAAAYIGKKHPNETMCVIYSDHLIKKKSEFQKKLRVAAKLAENENTFNIIEVKADSPNTNLGYVKIGKILQKLNNVEIREFKEFKEKPDKKTAKKFLKSGNYLWNTGYYVWQIKSILKAYEKHAPDTYKKLIKIQNAINTPQEKKVLKEIYPTLEKISIDYAIMEKLDPASVRIIPADLGWSDIGTWESLHENLAKKPTDNITNGKTVDLDSQGCIIFNSENKLIATVGLKNIAIIQTKDATLICDKSKSKDLKSLMEKIKKSNPELM